jgi:hypothetical protein
VNQLSSVVMRSAAPRRHDAALKQPVRNRIAVLLSRPAMGMMRDEKDMASPLDDLIDDIDNDDEEEVQFDPCVDIEPLDDLDMPHSVWSRFGQNGDTDDA